MHALFSRIGRADHPRGPSFQRNRTSDGEGPEERGDNVEEIGTARRWALSEFAQVRTLSEPAVSPDGTRVAVVVDAFRDQEDDRVAALYVVPTDGSSPPHRLTQGAEGVKSPQWSPDGRRLAFIAPRAGGRMAESAGRGGGARGRPAQTPGVGV